MKKLLLSLAFLLISFVGFSQFQITIQPVTVGNIGQYSANGINVNVNQFNITDTSITFQCNLINISGNNTTQVPDPWGSFIVTVSYPMNMTRTTLRNNA